MGAKLKVVALISLLAGITPSAADDSADCSWRSGDDLRLCMERKWEIEEREQAAAIARSDFVDCTKSNPDTLARQIDSCASFIHNPSGWLSTNLSLAHLNRGLAYTQIAKYDLAIPDFSESIRLQPGDSRALLGRALAYFHKRSFSAAIDDLTQYIKYNPDDANGYSRRGRSYLDNGEIDQAIADFEKAIAMGSESPSPYYGRARAYEAKREPQRAFSDYLKVLSLKADGPDAKWAKAESEKALARLAALAPASPAEQAPTPLPAVPSAARAIPLGHRVALVIGNSAYANAARLNNPERDARAVAASLRALGFAEVVERTDLGIQQLAAELKSFGDKAAQADWAVVYFAGHGIQVDGRTYLVPTDANLTRASHAADEALPLDRVLAKVADARQMRLVILDACRTNPFVPRMAQSSPTRSFGRGLALVENTGGVLVAYAARDGQVAEDGKGEHSPFTQALLDHLQQPGLEIGLLFRKVRDTVLKRTGGVQEPWTYGSIPSDELYFRAAAQK